MLGEETAEEHAPLEAQYTTVHSAQAATAPLLYGAAMFSRVLVATTFIIVLAAFASAWITLDVLAYAGVI